MDVIREVRDPSGRVVIREKDDRGERFPIIQTAPANLRGIDAFTEVWRSESMDRARRGQITFSVDARTDDTFSGFLHAELNVVGYVGGAGIVLQYLTIDPNQLGEWEWGEPDSYTAIALEARTNVNGVLSSDVTGIVKFGLNVSGSYWR